MAQNVVKQSNKKKIIIIIAAVVAVIGAIYLGFSIYFMGHFYYGSKIGEVDVSGKTAVIADEELQQKIKEYTLVIKERDGSIESITGNDINLEISWNVSPQSYIDNQKGFDWIGKLFKPETYEVEGVVCWDETKLQDKIAGLSAMQSDRQVAAVDATISEYNVNDGYTLVPSVPGTVVDTEVFIANIKNCIFALDESLDMAEGDNYVKPVIMDDNEKLLAAIAHLNKSLQTIITYQVGEKTEVLDATTFQPWLSMNENFEPVINEEAVAAYVNGLAENYNTYSKAKQFMTSYNKEIKITNCHYGWKLDTEAEKAAIIADILAGEPVSREMNFSAKAHSFGSNDYGNSYVEINLTAQHLFLYVNGKVVVETDFVSGNLSKNWNTPTGIWGMTYKTTKATLRGDNYATPVDYWMPYAGNVGMHDATWRNDFGGSIYKRDGSHGCINLPWSKAKEIYGYVKQGFPVIVYNLAGTESSKGIAQDQAYEMDKVIKAIGSVTLESEAKIVACRTQYDALSDKAKSYVKNYQMLVNAEKALATLKTPVVPVAPVVP